MALNNFFTAMYLANMLYGTSFTNEDAFAEIGLIAWNFIGNKNVRLHRFIGDVDHATLSLELPCNADIIEAVTLPFEDWNYTDGIHPNGDATSSYTELYIESRKHFTDPLYVHGKYVHYTRDGQTLYFDHPYRRVHVLYKGIILDENDLPSLNDKEVNAIAAYAAYVSKYKEGLSTNNAQMIQMALLLKADWERACDLARTCEHITLNEMDDILDAKMSSNRKSYGSSYKPMIK